MLLRPPRATVGMVGRFINIAPNLLQDGRSTSSPPRTAQVDWWAKMVELELAGPSSVAQANVLALPSDHAEQMDPSTDWWADLVQNEFAGLHRMQGVATPCAASKQSMALELAAPEWPMMSLAADCSTPTDADPWCHPPRWASSGLRVYKRRRETTEAHSPLRRRDELVDQELTTGRPTAADNVVVTPPGTTNVDGSPMAAAAPRDMNELVDRLCLPLQTPVARGPPKLRRSRTPAKELSLRRSMRIAAAPREADSTRQVQLVLMHKLGVTPRSPGLDLETVRKYKNTFGQPLLEASHEALQLLLGAEFDPVTLKLNMLGLEGEVV